MKRGSFSGDRIAKSKVVLEKLNYKVVFWLGLVLSFQLVGGNRPQVVPSSQGAPVSTMAVAQPLG